EDLEDQLLLAHAGRALDPQILADLGELGDAHLLQGPDVQGLRDAPLFQLVLCFCHDAVVPRWFCHRVLASSWSWIVLQGSFTPRPVRADTGRRSVSPPSARVLRIAESARALRPLGTWSILVATTVTRAPRLSRYRRASTSRGVAPTLASTSRTTRAR